MATHREFLIALADQLDQEGKSELADIVDKDFEEFLELLESGEFVFDPTLSGGQRDPRLPYNGRGTEVFTFGIPGPQ
jgi:hypothetical protein